MKSIPKDWSGKTSEQKLQQKKELCTYLWKNIFPGALVLGSVSRESKLSHNVIIHDGDK